MVEAALAGLHAQLLLSGDVCAHPLLDRMVDAVEGDPFLRPTHWATAAGLRDPYDRPVLIENVQAKRAEIVPAAAAHPGAGAVRRPLVWPRVRPRMPAPGHARPADPRRRRRVLCIDQRGGGRP